MTGLWALALRYRLAFCVYFLVGAAAALVEWGVFAAVQRGFDAHYLTASLAGFLVATFVNFLLSRGIAFQSRGRSRAAEFGLVYLASLAGLGVNLAVMAGLIELAGLDDMAAKVAGTAAAFLCNFAARQGLIFSPTPRRFGQNAEGRDAEGRNGPLDVPPSAAAS